MSGNASSLRKIGWNHRGRQALGQPAAQKRGLDRAFFGVVAGYNQLAVGLLVRHGSGLVDFRIGRHGAIDFAEFHAHAVDLHLAIQTSDELEVAVRKLPAQVAGAVGEFAGSIVQRAGNKSGGGPFRVAEVSLQMERRLNEDFADRAHAHGPAIGNQENAGAANWLADRQHARGIADGFRDMQKRLDHRRLGWAVEVDQPDAVAQTLARPDHVLSVERLASQ